jgi:cytochrome b involved in lipid metabolism
MSKNIPAPYKRRRFYTPEEVKAHNTANDCWVSFFHEVYDLTDLIQSNYSKLVDPIIKCAGEDITHWFDPFTKDVFYYKLAKTKSCRWH